MSALELCLRQLRNDVAATFLYCRPFAVAGRLYCRLFHRAISRPVNGRYRCWTCLREFEPGW